MFKKIIWATDGSESADRALELAKALASQNGSQLLVAHSIEIIAGPGARGAQTQDADEDETPGEDRRAGQGTRRAQGVNASLKIVHGGVDRRRTHACRDRARRGRGPDRRRHERAHGARRPAARAASPSGCFTSRRARCSVVPPGRASRWRYTGRSGRRRWRAATPSAPMSVTVVGSIAFDAVTTPFGSRERMLGGSAVHFAWPRRSSTASTSSVRSATTSATTECAVLEAPRHRDRGHRARRRAAGRSSGAASTAGTSTTARRSTRSSTCSPSSSRSCPTRSRAADVLFLANIQPDLQREVRAQCDRRAVRRARLDEPVDRDRARLADRERSREVDCLLLNDAELRQLTREPNLVARPRGGPRVGPARGRRQAGRVRRGDGHRGGLLRAAAFPLETVVDPTGAGDSFAGGFVGYIAAHPHGGARPRAAVPRDGLRDGARLVQRRGVRRRARRAADQRTRSPSASPSCGGSRASARSRSRCATDRGASGWHPRSATSAEDERDFRARLWVGSRRRDVGISVADAGAEDSACCADLHRLVGDQAGAGASRPSSDDDGGVKRRRPHPSAQAVPAPSAPRARTAIRRRRRRRGCAR